VPAFRLDVPAWAGASVLKIHELTCWTSRDEVAK
jgi:hypothetical protein